MERFMLHRDVAECVLHHLGLADLGRLRSVSRGVRRAVIAYSQVHHRPIACGRAVFDPVRLRWSARPAPPKAQCVRSSPTGVPGWNVLQRHGHYHTVNYYTVTWHGSPVWTGVSVCWPVVRPPFLQPSGPAHSVVHVTTVARPSDRVCTFALCGDAKTATVVDDVEASRQVQAPDAPLCYDGISLSTMATSFSGYMYGRDCDADPLRTVARVVHSFWVPELATLVLVPSSGPPWIVVGHDGSPPEAGPTKAHLQIPESMCRLRSSWSYSRGHLYVVGGKKPSGRRSSFVWHANLERYVRHCSAYPNLRQATEQFLCAFRDQLALVCGWTNNMCFVEWQAQFHRGLMPPSIVVGPPVWDVQTMPVPAADPAVRVFDHGRVLMVAGGFTTRDSRTSSVAFFAVGDGGRLALLAPMPQSFCPDCTTNH